jgi:hypothetical protein
MLTTFFQIADARIVAPTRRELGCLLLGYPSVYVRQLHTDCLLAVADVWDFALAD